MSENIVLEPGTRVRQDGKTYKVIDPALVTGTLEPTKAQTNRHLAIWCPDAECRETQIAVKKDRKREAGGKGMQRIGPDILRACDLSALPQCGTCGNVMVWRDKAGEDAQHDAAAGDGQ